MKEYWKTLSSKVVHENNWYKIVKKKFLMPNSKIGDYYILQTNGSSLVVPVKDGKIILCEQFRYPINKFSIEVPGGSVKVGSNHLKTAKEELKEEIGYSGKLKKIGEFSSLNGVSSEISVIYLATDLKYVGKMPEATEEFKIFEVRIKDVYKMIEEGKIIDSMTVVALFIAKKYLYKEK